MIEFHHAVGPLLVPLESLERGAFPNMDEELRRYFRDVADHARRVDEQVSAQRELLTSILEANLALLGVKQNEVVRAISAWAAIIAVPTFLASIWGMNFTHMPELDEPWGYWIALAMMAIAALALHRFSSRSAGFERPASRALASVPRVDALIDALAPLLLIVVAGAYAKRAHDARRSRRAGELWRQLSFGVGILLLLGADVPPLSAVAEELVVAHMVQHLLIGDLAGLFIALGLTGPILQPLLARRPFSWLRVLGNPLVALPLWALNLYLWHLSALYQGVLDSSLLHLAQHAGFFTFGLAMWLPLVGPLPKPSWFGDGAMLIYIVVVRLARGGARQRPDLVGQRALPRLRARARRSGRSAPLADQGAAGNVMMIWTGTVTLALFTWLFFRAANRSAEKQELLDLADAHGFELDPSRAARAVAAGQGERLRERILGG